MSDSKPQVVYELVVQIIGDEAAPAYVTWERFLPSSQPSAGLQPGQAFASTDYAKVEEWVVDRLRMAG